MAEPASNLDGVCVVALPAADSPINGVGDVDKHMTMVWLGNTDEVGVSQDELAKAVAQVASSSGPLTGSIDSIGKLGDDGAEVAFVNGDGIGEARDMLLGQDPIKKQHDAVKQYPTFQPHVSLQYPDAGAPSSIAESDLPDDIKFDRLGLWYGDEHTEYPLSGVRGAAAPLQWSAFSITAAAQVIPANDHVKIVLPVPNQTAASLTFGSEIPDLYAPLIDLGPVSEMTKPKLDAIFDAVGAVTASNRASLPGNVSSSFGTNADGGTWVRPDVDGLQALKTRLLTTLVKGGVKIPGPLPDQRIELHNASPVPDAFFDQPPKRTYFDRLAVMIGDDVVDFTFGVLSSGALLASGKTYASGDILAAADIGLPDEEDIVYPDAQKVASEVSGEGSRFRIPLLVPEGIETGDGRIFDPLSVKSRDLPLPLMWQIKTAEAHNGAVLVGRIDSIDRTEQGLGNARGVFDVGPYAREAQRLVSQKFLRGVSADLDMFEAEAEMPDEEEIEVIAVSPSNSKSAAKHKKKNRKITSTPVRISSARVMGATLVPKPAFQESTIELVEDEPEIEEEEPLVADGIYMARPSALDAEALTACGLVAAAIPTQPPGLWFDRPLLNGPTPISVTDEGQVFGHIAAWETDHIGLPFGTKPPRSRSGYAYFHTGVCRTNEGRDVTVGQLTLAGGHASLELSASAAVKHYDDTASAIADVHAGEDAFGIWVAGALRPGTSAEQIRALRASAPSGDWRPIGGRLELVAICQVNVPGFPIARARVASGYVTALVAAGARSLAEMRGPTLEERLAVLEHNSSVLVASVSTAEQVLAAAARVRTRFHALALREPMPGDAITTKIELPPLEALQADIAAASDDASPLVRREIRHRAIALHAAQLIPAAWNTHASLHEEFTMIAAGVAAVNEDFASFRDYSKKAREDLAKDKKALPDGSYPVANVEDLRRAIRAYGRSPKEKRAAVRRHIIRRARGLNRADLIPESWKAASVNNAVAQVHRDRPDFPLIADGIYMGLSSAATLTAALKFRPDYEFKPQLHPRGETGEFVHVLARLHDKLKEQAGTQEAVEGLERAQSAADKDDLKTAKEEADRVVGLVDGIAEQTVGTSNRAELLRGSDDLGSAIAALPIEQGRDDAVKYRFTDLPETLQTLIRDLMDRLADVVSPEKFDELTSVLRTFMSGGDLMGADEIQSNLTKMLGPLIMSAR